MANKNPNATAEAPSAPEQAAPDDPHAAAILRAEHALGQVRSEMAALVVRRQEAQAEMNLLRVRLMSADLRAAALRDQIAAGPSHLAAARADVLTATPATEAQAARELADLQQRMVAWKTELAELEGAAEGTSGSLAADEARLIELEDLAEALEKKRSEAEAALGRATLARVQEQCTARQQQVAAARAALEAADSEQRATWARALDQLGAWPALVAQARATYEPAAAQSPLQRLAQAALDYFGLLEAVTPELPQVIGGLNVVDCFSVAVPELNHIWHRPEGVYGRPTLSDYKKDILRQLVQRGEQARLHY